MSTPVLDVDDLLRAELVLLVSALDHYVHEKARTGMMEAFSGLRPQTEAFERFPIPLAAALGSDFRTQSALLDGEVRARHGHLSFQKPDAIADAIRLISPVELWNELGRQTSIDPKALKSELALIVQRRNQIAHEADLDPSYPGAQWPIDRPLVEKAMETISRVVEAIESVV